MGGKGSGKTAKGKQKAAAEPVLAPQGNGVKRTPQSAFALARSARSALVMYQADM